MKTFIQARIRCSRESKRSVVAEGQQGGKSRYFEMRRVVVLQSFEGDVVTRPVSERKGAVTQAATYFQDSLGACEYGSPRSGTMTLLIGVVVAALGFASCVSVSPAGAMDCNAIQTAYAFALRQAQFCDLATPDSCGSIRPWAPQDVCRCQVAVNPKRTAELDRLLAQFQTQGCPLSQRVCNRVCLTPARSCAVGAGPSPTCTGP